MSVGEKTVSGVNETIAPPSAYRYYALGLLTLTFTIDMVDRNILTILMEPIKLELDLSDSQLGVVYGVCFALFFGIFSIPIATWADRANRRNIMSLATAIFSGMTVVTGFATGFWHLVVARFGVAIGEAGTSSIAHSIISDMFPREKRASAMGIHALGINLGTLVGLLVGGWVNQWYGWRAAFLTVGIPGLIIALLLRFTLREPVRGHADGLVAQGQGEVPGIWQVFRLLWSQHSFRHIAAGTILSVIGGAAAFIWLPTFLMRSFHMQSGEVGTMLALLLGVVGGIGTYLFGIWSDKLSKRDIRWNMWIIAIAFALIFPFWCAVYLAPTKNMALLLLLYPAFAAAALVPPAFATAQMLVTVRMRTRVAAIMWIFINALGTSIGPQITGILSDLYHPRFGQESLRYALLTGAITWLWSAAHFFLAAKTVREDVARVRAMA